MKLQYRYRKLSFWNKIAFWGALSSMISIPIAIGLFLIRPRVEVNVNADDFFAKLNQNSVGQDDTLILTRTFWLIHEKGTTVTLGPCPGPNCFKFELGEIKQRNNQLVQHIYFSGEGFGAQFDPDENIRFMMKTPLQMKGAWPVFYMAENRMAIAFILKDGAYVEMFPETVKISMMVINKKSDSLKIKLEVRPPVEDPFSS